MMRLTGRWIVVCVAFAFAIGSGVAGADEATCETVISAAPYTISTQGHYCLGNDLTYFNTTGAAITIDANSVVLDLAGFKIGGAAAGAGTQAYGIRVNDRSTVVIRNGLIRGFSFGIYFEETGGTNNNLVANIRADGNTNAGIVISGGDNNTVRDCAVGSTGGTTDTQGFVPIGIRFAGTTNSFVIDSTVTNTTPCDGCANLNTFGIYASGTNNLVVNNKVIGNGNTPTTAYCYYFTGTAHYYRDNIATACGVNYNLGTAISNNYP